MFEGLRRGGNGLREPSWLCQQLPLAQADSIGYPNLQPYLSHVFLSEAQTGERDESRLSSSIRDLEGFRTGSLLLHCQCFGSFFFVIVFLLQDRFYPVGDIIPCLPLQNLMTNLHARLCLSG